MRESARLRPDHPELLYGLADAFALTGNPDSALTCLEQIAEMGLTAPAREDSALISLQSDRRFKSVIDRFDVNTQPTMNCRIAFTLPQQDLVPEGLAYDPGSKSFFVSSVRERKIMRYQRGEITRFAGGLSDTLWSMMGMRLDAARGRLWVATSAIREGKGVPAKDLGGTGVLAFDIKTGVLSSRRILPADGAAHLFGDLTLDADGNVYVTDSSGGGLYRVPATGGGPQLVIPPGTFVSPQGLDMDESGRVLYVADYSQGVFRVDLDTKTAMLLRHPGRQTLLGIDGLYRYGNSLIAVQNGVRPQRVLRLGAERVRREDRDDRDPGVEPADLRRSDPGRDRGRGVLLHRQQPLAAVRRGGEPAAAGAAHAADGAAGRALGTSGIAALRRSPRDQTLAGLCRATAVVRRPLDPPPRSAAGAERFHGGARPGTVPLPCPRRCPAAR